MPVPSPDDTRLLALQAGLWLLSLNAAAWALAGIDRRRWAFGGRRLSESVMLWIALLGGWPGLMLGLRASTRLKVRYDYTFRGWLRAVVLTQALFAALALTPRGGLIVVAERVADVALPGAFAKERDDRPGRVVMDRDRGKMAVTGVVTLRADP